MHSERRSSSYKGAGASRNSGRSLPPSATRPSIQELANDWPRGATARIVFATGSGPEGCLVLKGSDGFTQVALRGLAFDLFRQASFQLEPTVKRCLRNPAAAGPSSASFLKALDCELTLQMRRLQELYSSKCWDLVIENSKTLTEIANLRSRFAENDEETVRTCADQKIIADLTSKQAQLVKELLELEENPATTDLNRIGICLGVVAREATATIKARKAANISDHPFLNSIARELAQLAACCFSRERVHPRRWAEINDRSNLAPAIIAERNELGAAQRVWLVADHQAAAFGESCRMILLAISEKDIPVGLQRQELPFGRGITQMPLAPAYPDIDNPTAKAYVAEHKQALSTAEDLPKEALPRIVRDIKAYASRIAMIVERRKQGIENHAAKDYRPADDLEKLTEARIAATLLDDFKLLRQSFFVLQAFGRKHRRFDECLYVAAATARQMADIGLSEIESGKVVLKVDGRTCDALAPIDVIQQKRGLDWMHEAICLLISVNKVVRSDKEHYGDLSDALPTDMARFSMQRAQLTGTSEDERNFDRVQVAETALNHENFERDLRSGSISNLETRR